MLRPAPVGCDAVYSEDLSSEQDYDGLRVINPFVALLAVTCITRSARLRAGLMDNPPYAAL